MIYVLHLLDKPDSAALRQRVRPEHKAYLGAVAERIAFAGPLMQDDGVTMVGSLLAIDFASRDAALAWLADEPFTRAGLYASSEIHAFVNLWPQRRVPDMSTIKHIVMWNVRGDDADARAKNIALLKTEFESLRGRIPGLLHLEVGIDDSRIDYACDVVLVTEFESRQALADYAQHPEHLRVRAALGDLRSARHQVDYEIQPEAGRVHAVHEPHRGDKDHVQTL